MDEILEQIEALPSPESVDSRLFRELKSELAAKLRARGIAKIAAAPPTGSANQISDLTVVDNGDGTYGLTWHYRNLGDYDQNGSVGISDITPIAMLYNSEVQGGDDNSLTAVVDGSGNGKVDISDVTPIAMNFGVQCNGYALEASDTLTGTYSWVQDVPFSEGFGLGRKQFSVDLPDRTERYWRVCPFDASAIEGPESNIAVVPEPPPGEAPEIASVDPASGYTGSMVEFTAEVTGDPPLSYAWEFGGGADPDTSTDEAPTATLLVPGDYAASLTVTNEYGEDVYEFLLHIYAISGRADWWTYRHDPQLTGCTGTVGPDLPRLAWKQDIGYATCSAVEDSLGQIAIPGGKWFFYLLDVTGAEVWSHPTTADLRGSPAITAEGGFVFGCADGNLYVLRPGDGSVQWQFDVGLPYWATTPAIAPDGSIAVFSRSTSGCHTFYIISPDGEGVATADATRATGDIAVGPDGHFYWATASKIYGYDTGGTLTLDCDFERYDPDVIQHIAFAPSGYIIVVGIWSISAYDTAGDSAWDFDAPVDYQYKFAPAIGPDNEIYVLCDGTSTYLYCYDASQELAWQYEILNDSQCPPIVDGDGKVYLGTKKGEVICLGADGNLLWNWNGTGGDDINASFVLTEDGLLLVPSTDGYLYAIEQGEHETGTRGPWWSWGGNGKHNSRSTFVGPKTDHVEWTYECGGVSTSCPLIGDDGTIYITTDGPSLQAVTPDGDSKWSVGLGTRGSNYCTQGPDGSVFVGGAPNLLGVDLAGQQVFSQFCNSGWRGCVLVDDEGRVFATTDNNTLYAYAPDGTELWPYTIHDDGKLAPALGDDGTIYFGDAQGHVYAFDPATGDVLWSYDAPVGFDFGTAVGNDGRLYAVSNQNLLCIDPVTEDLAWFFNAPDRLYKLPAIAADGTLYIGCADGNLYRINTSGDGEVHYYVGDTHIQGQCTVDADGVVYFGAGENVYAVDSEGDLVWHHQMAAGNPVQSGPAIAENGTLYIGCGDEGLYAFRDVE